MAALSQLSYSPELVVRGEVYPLNLVVPGAIEAETEGAGVGNEGEREVVAAAEVGTEGDHRVDLVLAVDPSNVACRRVTASGQVDDEHVALAPGPFALDPLETVAPVEYEVVPLTLTERARHVDAQAVCRRDDRSLGDVALLRGGQVAVHGRTLVRMADGTPAARPLEIRPRR